MKIGLRIFLGYFLIVGLAGFFVMRVFVNEVKPGVRQAMEDTLVDTANVLAELATPDQAALREAFARAQRQLWRRMQDRLQRDNQRLDHLGRRLVAQQSDDMAPSAPLRCRLRPTPPCAIPP